MRHTIFSKWCRFKSPSIYYEHQKAHHRHQTCTRDTQSIPRKCCGRMVGPTTIPWKTQTREFLVLHLLKDDSDVLEYYCQRKSEIKLQCLSKVSENIEVLHTADFFVNEKISTHMKQESEVK